jgi:predicted O-methyltransferase YrrM
MSVEMIPYVPKFYVTLLKVADVGTAWNGIESILYDIVARFSIPQKKCLEFGVQWGYSTSALANVFEKVIGVDTFTGDEHAGFLEDHFKETSHRLKEWPNIELVQARYQDFIVFDDEQYDLIHVDIIHTYIDTYVAGRWALHHSPVVIFHDTIAFPDVMTAVQDLACDFKRKFYNYDQCHGLGILVKQ